MVAAAMEPGAIASEIARAAWIHTSQVCPWRGRMRISGLVDPSTVSALMKALAKVKRRQ